MSRSSDGNMPHNVYVRNIRIEAEKNTTNVLCTFSVAINIITPVIMILIIIDGIRRKSISVDVETSEEASHIVLKSINERIIQKRMNIPLANKSIGFFIFKVITKCLKINEKLVLFQNSIKSKKK